MPRERPTCASDGRFSVADLGDRTRLVSLASGSSGNALLVQRGSVVGLIDCGIGPNRLRSELLAFGLRLADLSFVFVTHEHIDHIRAVPALRKAGVPVVTGAGTAQAMGLGSREWIRVKHGKRFECGGIEVSAVRTSHDAAESLGAVVQLGELTAAVFTDMGEWDHVTVDAMSRADVIVVEANHNIDMLKRGPYPAHLKRRVLSPRGPPFQRRLRSLDRNGAGTIGKESNHLSGAPVGNQQHAETGCRRCGALGRMGSARD